MKTYRFFFAGIFLCLALISSPRALAGTYTTTFSSTENPISEGGHWLNGKTVGLDWSDIQTLNGVAVGLQPGPYGYDDSTAILTGTWGANQTVKAVVYTRNQNKNLAEEVELRLRSTLSAHVCNGYEVLFSLKPDSSAYVSIVRWNGPVNNWTTLDARGGSGLILHDGDEVMGTISNQTITAYINGTQVLQVTDGTYSSGNPGIGFYLDGGTGVNNDYGFTSFTATDGGTSVSNPPATTAYVTGLTLGTVRNNYSGYVGMSIVMGANPITVSALGRMMVSGNSGTHALKLVKASGGADVPGGGVSISMGGGTAGQFKYASLSSPVTLTAGETYYVLSQEAAGGDAWYDYDSMVTTSAVATENNAAWGYGPGQWYQVGGAGRAFVPVDFKYAAGASNPPAASGYVTGLTPGTVRNNFSGYVGMSIVVGGNPITVSALGRIMVNGNNGTHTLKLVKASGGADVPGGVVSLSMGGGTAGQFKYATLSSPVTLTAGETYYVLSQEAAGGDAWYDYDSMVTTSAVATENNAAWGYGPGQWYQVGGAGRAFVPVDFKYSTGASNPPPAAAPYVTGLTLGTVRNNYSGYVGMSIVVGPNPITVSALGRMMVSGNSGTHALKLVKASGGADVPGGVVSLSMGGGTAGQFKYASLSNPVTLAAGETYYVLSQEAAGGDSWYDYDSMVTTSTVATENNAAWGFGPGQWHQVGGAGRAFVPVNFKYTTNSQ